MTSGADHRTPRDNERLAIWFARARSAFGAPGAPAVISAIGAVVAVIALVVQSLLTQAQLAQASMTAYSYQGAQQYNAYRNEVLQLWRLGIDAEHIKGWFRTEKGGESPDEQSRNAYQDREEGCGSVESLLQQLPPTPPPSARAGS